MLKQASSYYGWKKIHHVLGTASLSSDPCHSFTLPTSHPGPHTELLSTGLVILQFPRVLTVILHPS